MIRTLKAQDKIAWRYDSEGGVCRALARCGLRQTAREAVKSYVMDALFGRKLSAGEGSAKAAQEFLQRAAGPGSDGLLLRQDEVRD